MEGWYRNTKRKNNKEEDEKKEDGDCCKATGLSVLLSVWITKVQLDKRNIHLCCLELVSVLQGALKVSSTP
jgi:hypothetical protein